MSKEESPNILAFEATSRMLGETVVGTELEVPHLTYSPPPIDTYPSKTWMWLARRNAQNSNDGVIDINKRSVY